MATGRAIGGRSHATGHPRQRPIRSSLCLQRLTRAAPSANDEEDQREAAELLHALGTSEAMRRLGTRPRHAHARALLRDTRWDTAEAGPVPILGEPAPFETACELVMLRLRRAAALAAARWAGASAGGGIAGLLGRRHWRRDTRGGSLECGVSDRGAGAGGHRRMLRRCWRRRSRGGIVGRGIHRAIAPRARARLRCRSRRQPGRCDRAMAWAMEPGDPGRRERRHRRRTGGAGHRRAAGLGYGASTRVRKEDSPRRVDASGCVRWS